MKKIMSKMQPENCLFEISMLQESLEFNDQQKTLIHDLKIQCEDFIKLIENNQKKLAEYNTISKRKLPDVANLYSILFVRKKTTRQLLNEAVEGFKKTIEQVNLGLLIRAAETDPAINTICKRSELNEIWNEKWRQATPKSLNSIETKDAPLEYKPQPTIHSFDLLKGTFFYACYRTLLRKEEVADAQHYLMLAAKLGHYTAVNTYIVENLKQPSHSQQVLAFAQQAAELYRTPGYILLCVVYYEMRMYKEALTSLMMAEKLIPASGEMMINAYQGRSFESIAEPLMNSLEVQDWPAGKVALAKLAELPIAFVTTNLDAQVTASVNDILQNDQKNDWALAAETGYCDPKSECSASEIEPLPQYNYR